MNLRRSLATIPALALLLAGCGASSQAPMAPQAPAAAAYAGADMAAPSMPPPINRSYFAKDQTGSVGEDDLQRILEAPIDLQLPARVGVVPLAQPFDPKENASIGLRGTASRNFAQALSGNQHFSQVTDISTDLPNVGGIEGLRAIAARYRVRYLILYSERFQDDTHLNGWAWLYPTIIGMFVAPGVTVQSHGIAQADFLDVRSGTVLFSVVEPLHVSGSERMIGAARAHRDQQAEAAAAGARALAKRVAVQTNALVAFADSHDNRPATRLLPPPVLATGPGTAHQVLLGPVR
ncbi:hypothetical protein [Polyangium aurulentum]|uniref:hypothetical protein n=1 Tax=Polyangium aurulentum TaxID=2567896 RepID=UPI0010AE3817|nr:hypothetical protein [Polyangium aurulentum]UQA62716.1 hypothetical protein E8A73_020595 [Polyangium aurulentum]